MAAASGAPRDDPSSEPSTAAVAVDVTTAPLDAIGDVAAAVETVPATPEENTRGNADDETRDSAGADLATTHDIEDSTSSDVQLDEFDDFVNASATGQGPWEVHTAGTIVRNLPEHDDGSHSPLPFPGDFAGTDGVMSGGNPSQTVPLWVSPAPGWSLVGASQTVATVRLCLSGPCSRRCSATRSISSIPARDLV